MGLSLNPPPSTPSEETGGILGLSLVERRAVVVAWVIAMAIVGLVIFMDIITQSLGGGRGFAAPLVEELTSFATMAPAMLVAAAVAVWLRRQSVRPLWRAAAVGLVGGVAYFAIHVGGFNLLRSVIFPLVTHKPYSNDGGLELLYEASKDAPAYLLSVLGFWASLRWLPAVLVPPRAPERPSTFDIRDGARLVRAPTADILAVRSAGNYVEFLLADGRTPLMRSPLSEVEGRLAAHRFVRTHRSWLVNAARVTGLRPDGSGDYTVELGALEAPLSRRFREALSVLRP